MGGLLGAVYIVAAIVLAPRLGRGHAGGGPRRGSDRGLVLIDHFGWVGFAAHPVSPLRILGAVLVVRGVVLVQR